MAVSTISRRRAVALLLLTSILLITLDVNGNPVIDRARSAFSAAVRPFETAALVVWRPIQRGWNGVSNYNDLQAQIEDLRAEIEAMRGADVAARANILEYNELLTLTRLDTLSEIPTVTAQVVGDAPSNFQLTVEIDKGSEACIATGMPVVGPGGLIGKITEAHSGRAVVMLITDPRYSVGVKIVSTIDEATATSTTGVAAQSTTPSGIAVDDLTSTTLASSTTTTSTTVGSSSTTVAFGQTTSTSSTSSTSSTAPASSTSSPSSTRPDTATTSTLRPVVVRETGQLTGLGPDELPRVILVDSAASSSRPQVGDSVLTSGGSDSLAPDGVPIGTVSRVIQRTSSSGPVLEVQYSADIEHLNFVSVLLYRPASEDVNC